MMSSYIRKNSKLINNTIVYKYIIDSRTYKTRHLCDFSSISM